MAYDAEMRDDGGRTDDELLEHWRDGDRSAGDAFVERMFEPLRRFIESQCGHEVEELVQETLKRAVVAKTRFLGKGGARAFVFGIARNVVREHYRRRSQREDDIEESSVRDLSAGPSTLRWRRKSDELLLEALRTLHMRQQAALQLYYWEDFNKREIAQILEIPEGTVASRIDRARERLREIFEGTSPPSRPVQVPSVVDPPSTSLGLQDWAERIGEMVPSPKRVRS